MSLALYDAFVKTVETPLKNIDPAIDPKYYTKPLYLPGSIRHEAESLKKGLNGRSLPAVIAMYEEDDLIQQKQQRKSRTAKLNYDIKNERSIIIHGVVRAFNDGDVPGDYLRDIEELLHDVKRALNDEELKLVKVGYILDNDDQSLGLAGFVLKATYNVTENFEYD